MAVRKIGKSWRVDIRWDKNRRYRIASPLNTRAGAEAYEAELRHKLARGEQFDAQPHKDPTFAEFSAQWFDTYVRANNKTSEQRAKESILRLHLNPWFGPIKLSHVKTPDVEAFKAAKRSEQLSNKTVNNFLAVLGKCLRTAVEWELIPAPPRIKLLRAPQPAFDFLTWHETEQLLTDGQEPMWNMMVRLAVRTGMRRGELCALEWSDVDLEHRQLTVRRRLYRGEIDAPKGAGRIRHLRLTEDVLCVLQDARRREGLVFHRADGRYVADTPMTDALRRMCRRAGLRPIGWHVLRHTFASQVVAEGVPLPVVQQIMGHSSIGMTMRYAHLAPDAQRGAIDALERASVRTKSANFGHPMGTVAVVSPSHALETAA